MKRLIFLILLIGGLATYLYSTNPEIKSAFDNWAGIAQPDSVNGNQQADSISSKTYATKNRSKKNKIRKTLKPDQYAQLDKYARETPDKYSSSNATLAEYLSKRANNDLEKARLIFTWIATHIHYDDQAFNTGKYSSETADSVLIRRKAVCEGFSSLYQELGLLMGLEVEAISGYAKGYGYEAGSKFSSVDHAWNAVKIGGTWKLIDVTWGGSGGRATETGLRSTMKFDPYWFCVSPEAFIFSHLPEDQKWQLTSETITLAQYENLPYLDATFFKLGFDAEGIFQEAVTGSKTEFVETFPLEFPVNGSKLPTEKTLQFGKTYTFSIESEYLEQAMIIDGKQWIELKKEGTTFVTTHTPKGDNLQVVVRVNWFDKNYFTIVEYDIVQDKDPNV